MSGGSAQALAREREEGRRQTALESRRVEESREASAFKRRRAEEVAANEHAASAGATLPPPAAGTTHISPGGTGGGSGHSKPTGPGARELEEEARQRKRALKRTEREARHHHRKHSPMAREAANVAATSCSGVYGGGGPEVIVPGGASCTLAPGTSIPGNVRVEPGGTLLDEGAAIGGNLVANSPAGIQIKGTTPGTITANVRIVGLTGAVEGEPNMICNVTIGENLLVSSSEASAAPVLIGGGPECRPVTVKLDVNVYGNSNRVGLLGDLFDKELLMEANTGPVEAAEDHILGSAGAGGNKGGVTMRNLRVRGFLSAQRNPGQVLLEGNTAGGRLFVRDDTGGVTVSRNRVGASAECVDDRPRARGAPNQIKGRDTGCPKASPARRPRGGR